MPIQGSDASGKTLVGCACIWLVAILLHIRECSLSIYALLLYFNVVNCYNCMVFFSLVYWFKMSVNLFMLVFIVLWIVKWLHYSHRSRSVCIYRIVYHQFSCCKVVCATGIKPFQSYAYGILFLSISVSWSNVYRRVAIIKKKNNFIDCYLNNLLLLVDLCNTYTFIQCSED